MLKPSRKQLKWFHSLRVGDLVVIEGSDYFNERKLKEVTLVEKDCRGRTNRVKVDGWAFYDDWLYASQASGVFFQADPGLVFITPPTRRDLWLL